MTSWHVHENTSVSQSETVTAHSRTEASTFSGCTVITSNPEGIHGHKRHPTHKEMTLDPRLMPAVIPPEHSHRTLVLCFDGTGDQFDGDNSNIVQLVSLLKKNDRSQQMVYYQTGIGTYTSPQVISPLMLQLSKTLDEMIAWNLDSHVMGGYEFLMKNYLEGDKICIFGFSRGAYTARSLAGMLHKVGLLPPDNYQQIPFAYKMYARTDSVGWEQSNAFKAAFSLDVDIEFLGVWDTVDSVGLSSKRLPFTTSNTIVRTFRHAVSLDERRSKFKVNLWTQPTLEQQALGLRKDSNDNIVDTPQAPLDSPVSYEYIGVKRSVSYSRSSGAGLIEHSSEEDEEMSFYEHVFSQKEKHTTNVEEVWFAGCHADVGGGSVSNKTKNSLARISLRWMIRECFKTNSGIMFDSQALKKIGLDPTTVFPYVTPKPPLPSISSECYQRCETVSLAKRIASFFRKPKHRYHKPTMTEKAKNVPETINEEQEDLKDALTPVYDQLKLNRIWWILEIMPIKMRYQKDDYEWISYFGSNFAKPRNIPRQFDGIKVHRTVQLRMQANAPKGLKKYEPQAQFLVEPEWVD